MREGRREEMEGRRAKMAKETAMEAVARCWEKLRGKRRRGRK